MSAKPRGRFAPSPSGRMHLGNAFSALMAWLSVRSKAGTMILRMEDLDPARSKEHFARSILDDMAWLGLEWDEGPDKGGAHGPYRQSARRARHEQCLVRLADLGLLYPCYCSRAELHDPARAPHLGQAEPVYPGTCRGLSEQDRAARQASDRGPALRVKVGPAKLAFTDLVLGRQEQELSQQCGDFILRRGDGVCAYQLAVVADDAAQAVSEVVRGADLLSSTPRQIYLFQTLGFAPPNFAHVPLLVDPNGQRLSKRRQDTDLGRLREMGVTAETIIGYLAWKAGLLDGFRAVSPGELLTGFHLADMASGPVVVEEDWWRLKA